MLKRLLLALFVGAALVLATAGTVRVQQVGSAERGLLLASKICADCHAVSKGEGRSANTRAPPFTAIANVPGMTNAALSAALATSHRTMPNIILKNDEMSDVIAYIQSLKRAD